MSYEAFWSISSKVRTTMRGAPEQVIEPRPGKEHLAERYWAQRSRLLVANKHDTVSGRLVAVYSDTPSVGSGWVPVGVEEDVEAKSLCAWWNSTPVRLMLLNRRSKKLTYPSWSLDQLRSIPVPSPASPGWEGLLAAYEQACDIELLPLRDAEKCEGRRIIDRAAAHVLGVPESTIADWRRRLAIEPTISNRPAEASADQLS
ncbi:MAG: hypothetical protein F4Z53_10725 [Acidimicrobiales bacterium]|nr:hypothetical protein [Acidimicrobiales bacterium]MYD32923.1 hypothetical protein [Acidimicrobiales bacterium]MYI10862.1 hypothetical protein [Acidimicrobiales bacterium]MYI28798.1 hypothetical protein [Acidimicrobiales bacterium]